MYKKIMNRIDSNIINENANPNKKPQKPTPKPPGGESKNNNTGE